MDVIVSDGVLELYKFVFTEVNTSSCKCAIWSIEQILEAPAAPLVILIGITYTSEVSDLEFVNSVIIIRFYRKTTRISKDISVLRIRPTYLDRHNLSLIEIT